MADSTSVRVRRPTIWRQTPVTWILIVVNVLWYVFIEGHYGLSIEGLVRSGALDWPDVISGGQSWRLVTAMFVHMGIAHIGLNMVSLGSLYVVEWLIGSRMFLTTYLVSGFVGDVATLFLGDHHTISGGASGAIFGIFGVALYMALKGILTKAARNQLLVILVINLVYGFSSSHIANSAHLGGLVAGAAMAAMFVMRPQLKYSKFILAISVLFAVVTLICLALAVPGHSAVYGT